MIDGLRSDDAPRGDGFGLTDAVAAIDGLRLFGVGPGQLRQDDVGGNLQIETDAGRGQRADRDGDIGVGGATLATALLRAHLLDELLLFTHPVVLGAGRPLFDGLDEPLQLDLLEQRSFASGVTMHRYAVRDATGNS